MPLYCGIDGVKRKITGMYTGINGVKRKITEMWAAESGVKKLVYQYEKLLKDISVGSTIKLIEDGKSVDFYVAKHNYESGLNGSGRTLVVRKDVYSQRQWDSSDRNSWKSSSVYSWLNKTYMNMLDADLQSLIGSTAYYYTPGNRNWSVTTTSDPIFLLSATELNIDGQTWINTEGSRLQIASNIKFDVPSQWSRSPDTNNIDNAIGAMSSPSLRSGSYSCTESMGVRPVFTLPDDFKIME